LAAWTTLANRTTPIVCRAVLVMLGSIMALSGPAPAMDQYELPPIEYSQKDPANRISRLAAAIERGDIRLRHESRFGYLRDLLQYLEIHDDTQMLVFSKTSMQRNKISPRTPRAIYFNDDSYVGYCQEGNVIEIATADPRLGAVFYTLDQKNQQAPIITRQTQSCLQCHGGAQTDNIPGFVVRSLFVGPSGLPILSEGSYRVDPTTPIENRWGGWYVTGTHGKQTHLGNLIIRDESAKRPWKNEDGQNVTELTDRFAIKNYLSGQSDLIALLVFEHQTYVHNLITQANFTTRQALLYERDFNKALGEPEDNRLESTTRRIESAGEKLLAGLLMVDEAPLAGPFVGTSTFSERFAQTGPFDRQGRSLREFDLQKRTFKFPCSYLVYSPDFNALPPDMMSYLKKRLGEILAGQGGEKFAHLSQADRESLVAILKDTKPELIDTL
jgi:hypothetical protein